MMNFSLWFALALQQGQKMSQFALWPMWPMGPAAAKQVREPAPDPRTR